MVAQAADHLALKCFTTCVFPLPLRLTEMDTMMCFVLRRVLLLSCRSYWFLTGGVTLFFRTTDITEGWNGTYHGLDVAAGTYVYIIKGVIDDKQVMTKG